MPSKAKKLDPELQKAQFEEWKEKDEYRVWSELQIISKNIEPTNISETTPDLTGNWQVYHDKLYEMITIFKLKPKFKLIEHQHIRTAFFAAEDIEINKQIIQLKMDGFHYSVDKQDKDKANHVKQSFAKIYRQLEDRVFGELTPENYMESRKELVKQLNEFVKKLPVHIKQSHKIIDAKLTLVLSPLKNLLEVNKKLIYFDLRYTDKRSRQVMDFTFKAHIDEYCLALQECQKILTEYYFEKDKEGKEAKVSQIPANPNVRLIFNKLAYEDWQKNKIESFYLSPLQFNFDKMRDNLLCLMIKGINYYKAPLNLNVQFLSDLKEVINAELIAEHLLGNAEKRDQLNFAFKVLSIIYNANQQAKEFLLKKDDNCIHGSIPKLMAYHTILYMRNWKDRKILDEKKEEKEREKNKEQQQQDQQERDASPNLSQYMSPDKKKQMDDRRDEMLRQAEEQARIKAQLDFEKYGRYWLWEFYCDNEARQIFEEASELIRHVNLAVQQDIEDEIIKEGMIPKQRDRRVRENDPSQMFNELRKADNANKLVIERRPPELWNYPKVIQEKHEFRAIADPKKCYADGRIEQIEKQIFFLGDHLMNNKPALWNELINRVIDALKESYQAAPTFVPSSQE